jgi:hypothetical protein
MAAPSRMHASNLLFLPPKIIQIIVDYLWPHETISLLIAVPKLADLLTDEQLRYQDRGGYTILHYAVAENAKQSSIYLRDVVLRTRWLLARATQPCILLCLEIATKLLKCLSMLVLTRRPGT